MFKKNLKTVKLFSGSIIQAGEIKKTAKQINDFYDGSPFPNYDDLESIQDLNKKLENNEFTYNFKRLIGFGNKIIEVGSGTSQLSISLASGTNNKVVAFDPTLASLRLGANFCSKYKINNCTFVNGDLFDNPFEENYFNIVWCSGVLHHTGDPKKGFETIITWLKPEGYVVIGLYNRYGRMRTVFRQKLFRLLSGGKNAKNIVSFLDPVLRKIKSNKKKIAWFRDQYQHPIESLHTLDEVLEWFDENNIEFISSIPSGESKNFGYEEMFNKQSTGSFFSRLISQLNMLISPLGSEGGLFIVIGKKKGNY